MNTPAVSVVIPCYQHGHWLGGALASVFAQTGPDIEAIVVNDGSTDDTVAVAREWHARYPGRVHVVDTPHVGQAKARRVGVEQASGDFMITLDADDLLEPGMAEACRAALARNPDAAAAAADVWMTDESGRTALRRLVQNRPPQWPAVLDGNPLGGVAGVMIRASAARRLGGLSVDGLSGVEDWDFAVRLARVGLSVVHVPRALARYRQSSSSFSHDPIPNLLAKIELFERCRRPDPRLEGRVDRQPVLDGAGYRHYRNRAVFFALGLAAAGRRETIPAVLALLAPGTLEREGCVAAFVQGAAHGDPAGVAPRGVAAVIREPLARALEATDSEAEAAGIAKALERAVARSRVKGPRYWLRRFEAWQATRRFFKT